MKRNLTNVVRYCMDEFLPIAIRDNYYFMYPFYRYWFSGSNNLPSIMRFKEIVHAMTEKEFATFYGELKCRANIRPTDCSEQSLAWALSRIDSQGNKTSLLDVGCGRGHCLAKFSELGLDLTGCDVYENVPVGRARYVQGNVEKLPFPDKSFDIVTCFHTLEHVRRLNTALHELKRVAKKQLFLIVPAQRFFHFTLDLHIHFFYSPVYFKSLVECEEYECELLGGDIVYQARMS